MKSSKEGLNPKVKEVGQNHLPSLSLIMPALNLKFSPECKKNKLFEVKRDVEKLFQRLPSEVQFEFFSSDVIKQENCTIEIVKKMQNVSPSAFKTIYDASLEIISTAEHTNKISCKILIAVAKTVVNTEEINPHKLQHKLQSAENEMAIAKIFHELKKQGIEHPHLLETYGVAYRSFNNNIHVYTAMPKMTGGSFAMLSHDPSWERRQEGCRQFASGVVQLHSLKIVHQDLKLDNAMFDSSQALVKIIDWGTHINFNPSINEYNEEFVQRVLRSLGTSFYNSPERLAAACLEADGRIQILGSAADIARRALYAEGISKIDPYKLELFAKKAECYAVCMTLYQIMVGELPEYIQHLLFQNRNLSPINEAELNKVHLRSIQRPQELPENAILKSMGQTQLSFEKLEDVRCTEAYHKVKFYLELLWQGLSFNPDERPPLEILRDYQSF